MNRDDRQQAVFKWAGDTFGQAALEPKERILRFLEEAVELAQAELMTHAQARTVVDYVFGKPPGDPEKEVGGVGVTLLAYCAARGFSADAAEEREFDRVQTIDPVRFRERQNKKAAAGIAAHVPEPGADQ